MRRIRHQVACSTVRHGRARCGALQVMAFSVVLGVSGCVGSSPPPGGSSPPSAGSPAPDPVASQLPVWMAGCWERREGDRVDREDWDDPSGGMMFGVSRSFRADTVRAWEFLRIAPDSRGVPVFWALPSGQSLATFTAVETGPNTIVFENPEHDFPQRIAYERPGASTLIARVGLLDGSRGFQITWRRVGCP